MYTEKDESEEDKSVIKLLAIFFISILLFLTLCFAARKHASRIEPIPAPAQKSITPSHYSSISSGRPAAHQYLEVVKSSKRKHYFFVLSLALIFLVAVLSTAIVLVLKVEKLKVPSEVAPQKVLGEEREETDEEFWRYVKISISAGLALIFFAVINFASRNIVVKPIALPAERRYIFIIGYDSARVPIDVTDTATWNDVFMSANLDPTSTALREEFSNTVYYASSDDVKVETYRKVFKKIPINKIVLKLFGNEREVDFTDCVDRTSVYQKLREAVPDLEEHAGIEYIITSADGAIINSDPLPETWAIRIARTLTCEYFSYNAKDMLSQVLKRVGEVVKSNERMCIETINMSTLGDVANEIKAELKLMDEVSVEFIYKNGKVSHSVPLKDLFAHSCSIQYQVTKAK